MNEDEFKPVTKVIRRELVQKQAYQIVRINENKATLLLHKLASYEDIAGSNNIILSSVGLIGSSVTLKVDKETMDKVIDNFGDIVAKVNHTEGVVTGIITFEEL